MYLVKTYLASSPIHGVGVFAAEFIPKGTKTWEFNPLIDIILTPEQVNTLPSQVKAFIEQHAFGYPFGSNNFCLSLDHSQYVNHHDTPNIVHQHGVSYALVDIEPGTELTNDYNTIDHRNNDAELKLG